MSGYVCMCNGGVRYCEKAYEKYVTVSVGVHL